MAKTYVGNGKTKSASWLKLSIDVEKLLKAADQFATTGKNGKKYLNLDINIKDTADLFGFNVSAAVDEYDPKKNGQSNGRNVPPPPPANGSTVPQASAAPFIAGHEEDLPF